MEESKGTGTAIWKKEFGVRSEMKPTKLQRLAKLARCYWRDNAPMLRLYGALVLYLISVVVANVP
jgi:hypothetical protein